MYSQSQESEFYLVVRPSAFTKKANFSKGDDMILNTANADSIEQFDDKWNGKYGSYLNLGMPQHLRQNFQTLDSTEFDMVIDLSCVNGSAISGNGGLVAGKFSEKGKSSNIFRNEGKRRAILRMAGYHVPKANIQNERAIFTHKTTIIEYIGILHPNTPQLKKNSKEIRPGKGYFRSSKQSKHESIKDSLKSKKSLEKQMVMGSNDSLGRRGSALSIHSLSRSREQLNKGHVLGFSLMRTKDSSLSELHLSNTDLSQKERVVNPNIVLKKKAVATVEKESNSSPDIKIIIEESVNENNDPPIAKEEPSVPQFRMENHETNNIIIK
jgi:hypothetical protein